MKHWFSRIMTGSILVVLGYLLYVPLSWLPAYNEFKLPVAAGLLLVLLLRYPLDVRKQDLWYVGFFVASLSSLLDIGNISWAWHQLAGWLLMILLVIALRPFFVRHEKRVLWVLQGVFWLTVLYLLGRMWQFRETEHHVMLTVVWPWQIFGKNTNVAPLVPMLLLPVVWFSHYRHKVVRVIASILALAAVLTLTQYFDFLMGWVILALMVGITIIALAARRWRLPIVAGGVAVLTLATVGIGVVDGGDSKTPLAITGTQSMRLSYDKIALAMAMTHPFNGAGLGSWFFSAGKYVNAKDSPALLKQDEKKRHLGIYTRNYEKKGLLPRKVGTITIAGSFQDFYAYNHNYLTRLLAETGLPGLLLWIGAPLWVLADLMVSPARQNRRKLMASLPLLGWVLSCLTMRMSVFDYIDLSEPQLIGMIGFCLWSAQTNGRELQEVPSKLSGTLRAKLLPAAGVLSALALVGWFSHNFLVNHNQLRAMRLAEQSAYCDAIETLAYWHHPVFRTTINDIEPIARHLARWSAEEGMEEEAIGWYEAALQCSPVDPGLRYEYRMFRKNAAEHTGQ